MLTIEYRLFAREAMEKVVEAAVELNVVLRYCLGILAPHLLQLVLAFIYIWLEAPTLSP